jgi:hypothetical protein
VAREDPDLEEHAEYAVAELVGSCVVRRGRCQQRGCGGQQKQQQRAPLRRAQLRCRSQRARQPQHAMAQHCLLADQVSACTTTRSLTRSLFFALYHLSMSFDRAAQVKKSLGVEHVGLKLVQFTISFIFSNSVTFKNGSILKSTISIRDRGS